MSEQNLVIVESPAKAKTIEKFLGSDFLVKSSYGHIRDLSKKKLGINIENNFEPLYEVSPDKKKIVAELSKLSKLAKTVWLASDEDREGEAIAWHLYETLGLKEDNTKRIVFHEITKQAIIKAIENPRSINTNLVKAQQARRVLDRLVGFELSPLLWKKIKPSLSAGRVQSVAVRILVEREREINSFKSDNFYRVIAEFIDSKTQQSFKAELNHRFKTKEETNQFLHDCLAASFTVEEVITKPAKKSPSAPFTTSTLQQEASRKLGFSVSQTMAVAQKLYESGQITYMRTDSYNLSALAINTAKETITEEYGDKYAFPRTYTTKIKGAQEAHEAIRPTYIANKVAKGGKPEQKLYDLIRKRTLASQMSDALLEKTNIHISISTRNEKFLASGEVIIFDGFLKAYLESNDDEMDNNKAFEDSGLLPLVQANEILAYQSINATERFTQRPARFTEASLVKRLEELGIGRPSTYAPTISTVQNRGYVIKEDRQGSAREFVHYSLKNNKISVETKSEIVGTEKAKLFPTDIGIVVNDFLIEHFAEIMDYHFTANVEKNFDEIAEGEIEWTTMIAEFYQNFHQQVNHTEINSKAENGQRLLGEDPNSGKPVYARIGRYGPMVQIGENDKESDEKPKYASIKKDQSIDTISLAEAMLLFKLPRQIGSFEDAEITVANGRFGPYVRHKSKFVSLKKDIDDPYTIELARAIELIEEKRKLEIEKIIKQFDNESDPQILNGRWGPYISYEKQNYKIPKGNDPKSLSLEECFSIIEKSKKAPAAKKRKG